ncbi:Hypothetical protein MVR_LOCUS244 [uncultured virus]|nr:Hypothetical protein MVR_LOCUS244 [uncultured virus]
MNQANTNLKVKRGCSKSKPKSSMTQDYNIPNNAIRFADSNILTNKLYDHDKYNDSVRLNKRLENAIFNRTQHGNSYSPTNISNKLETEYASSSKYDHDNLKSYDKPVFARMVNMDNDGLHDQFLNTLHDDFTKPINTRLEARDTYKPKKIRVADQSKFYTFLKSK